MPIRETRLSPTHQWEDTNLSYQEAFTSFLDQPHLSRGQSQGTRGTTVMQPMEWRLQSQEIRKHKTAEEYMTDEGTK